MLTEVGWRCGRCKLLFWQMPPEFGFILTLAGVVFGGPSNPFVKENWRSVWYSFDSEP